MTPRAKKASEELTLLFSTLSVDEACKFMIHAMVEFQWAFGTKQSLLLLMALTGGIKRLPVERYARMPAFVIVRNTPKMDKPIVIRDVGPWDAYPTVTNKIEAVIEKLRSRGLLPADRRLFYYDSEGMLTEAVMEAGAFVTYRNVRAEEEEIA